MPNNSQVPSDPALASVSGSPAPIARGMFYSDRCMFCHEFDDKVKPFICGGCWNVIKAVIAEYRSELLEPAQENAEVSDRREHDKP